MNLQNVIDKDDLTIPAVKLHDASNLLKEIKENYFDAFKSDDETEAGFIRYYYDFYRSFMNLASDAIHDVDQAMAALGLGDVPSKHTDPQEAELIESLWFYLLRWSGSVNAPDPVTISKVCKAENGTFVRVTVSRIKSADCLSEYEKSYIEE